MNGWEFQPARDRELRGIERHRSLVRENGLASSVARLFWWTILRAMLRVWHHPRVTGRENLPASPPFSSRTGEMQKFQSGIGRLVANSAVPVVPCHLEGCFLALPPGRRFPKPLSLAVTVGKPIRFDDCPDNRTGWDAIAARLQGAVEGFADLP